MNLSIIVILAWLVFLIYWSILNKRVKKTLDASVSKNSLLSRIHIRVIIIVMIIVELYSIVRQPIELNYKNLQFTILDIIGILLCVAGIAISIEARRHIGKNWSGIPCIKENHVLVTSGPYRFVRHPIYTGIFLATIGSFIIGSSWWIVAFIIILVVYIKRIPVEEGLMMQKFPDQYAEYRAKTKTLIPYII